MTWNVLLFPFSLSPRQTPCAIASSRQREITNAHAKSLKGTMTGSLASTSFSFMPRESDVTGNKIPPGDFGPARFRGGTPSAPSLSRVRRQDILQIVPPRGHEERDSAATARARAMHSNANISRPGTRRNRRNFMLLRNSTCSPYISSLLYDPFCSPVTLLPHPTPTPEYLITHPQVLWSAVIFHCRSGRNNRIISAS